MVEEWDEASESVECPLFGSHVPFVQLKAMNRMPYHTHDTTHTIPHTTEGNFRRDKDYIRSNWHGNFEQPTISNYVRLNEINLMFINIQYIYYSKIISTYTKRSVPLAYIQGGTHNSNSNYAIRTTNDEHSCIHKCIAPGF